MLLASAAPVAWTSMRRVDAGQFRVGGSAQETGTRIATAVHGGLFR